MAISSLRSLLAERQHAAVILARQAALREVKRRRQKRGLRETLPYAVLSRLANEWLDQHPELIDLTDPIVVQMSQVSNRKRKPAAQGLPVCKSQERNGARK